MWQAIMESDFIKGLTQCLDTFMTTIAIFAIMGLVSFALGEMFPRSWVHYDRFPYNVYGWEQEGRIYIKLRVNKWKDKVPDMSTYFKGMFYKKSLSKAARTSEYFERFVKETCVAEAVHALLMAASFIVFWVFPNGWGLIASILYSLGNIPFILIQRYNRPRFKLLMERQKQTDALKARLSSPKEDA